jgi:hypothetical protein
MKLKKYTNPGTEDEKIKDLLLPEHLPNGAPLDPSYMELTYIDNENIYFVYPSLNTNGYNGNLKPSFYCLDKTTNDIKENAKRKLKTISRFKVYSRFICCSNKVFYSCSLYILAFELLKYLNVNIEFIYLRTIAICIEYLCIYFVFRDGFTTIQNYIISKYKKASIVRISSIIILICLVYFFKVTLSIIVICNIILDKKINIRVKQSSILNSLVNQI